MITELTRRDLIDLFRTYDPDPLATVFATLGQDPPSRRGLRWWGRLSEIDFLGRLYDLDDLPSSDDRFRTAREDIVQHRVLHLDWEDDWIFSHQALELGTSDGMLLTFLAETLHPTVRPQKHEVAQLLDAYNLLLRRDRVQLHEVGQVSGRPEYAGGPVVPRNVQPSTLRDAIGQAIRYAMSATVVEAFCDELQMPPLPVGSDAKPMSSKAAYVCERLQDSPLAELEGFAREVLRRFEDDDLASLLFEIELSAEPSVRGTPKNLIFANNGPKPEIVLSDAVNNDVLIVRNAEYCLVYDRPIDADRGLSFADMVDWWRSSHPAKDENAAAKQLYERLEQGLNDPEAAILQAYRELLREHGFGLPAIAPQVWLHYDPHTIAERRAKDGRKLVRQRMDFLFLLPRKRRVVVELDGQQHYADGGNPRPDLYAAMVREDRRLRLQGYEVYRFGGFEFVDLAAGTAATERFFETLLRKEGVIP